MFISSIGKLAGLPKGGVVSELLPIVVKDKNGVEIKEFNVIKVFHFIGARRKRHYMYKWVRKHKKHPQYLIGVHLTNSVVDDGYILASKPGENILMDVEVVQDYHNAEPSNRTPAITQPESNEHKPSALPLGDAGKLVEALADIKHLRILLAHIYCPGPALYCDDGELQDSRTRPLIDFKRDSIAEIEKKMRERGRKKLALSTHLAGTSKGNVTP
jgi:hypothetical protein